MQDNDPTTQFLVYAVSDGVETITLNRPEKLNALNDEMVRDCVAVLEEAKNDDRVRVLVVTGAGKGFCSGADVGKMTQSEEVTPVYVRSRLKRGLQKIPLALAELDKPVIAAVNGVATGAGMDLALMCDIRFAAAGARMAENYTRLGLVPGAGGAYFLPRIVGAAKALELLWGADFVAADEALRLGLVNQVFPDAELLQRTYEFASKLAKAPPLAISLVKRAVYQGLRSDLPTGLDLISAYLAMARTSDDHAEAMAAFREKREGHYRGR